MILHAEQIHQNRRGSNHPQPKREHADRSIQRLPVLQQINADRHGDEEPFLANIVERMKRLLLQ